MPEYAVNPRTENVSTHDLKEGDIVLHYGVTFRLKDRKDHGLTPGFDPVTQGTCITFATEVLADNSGGFFPKSWQTRFTIQGNRMALWARVIGN